MIILVAASDDEFQGRHNPDYRVSADSRIPKSRTIATMIALLTTNNLKFPIMPRVLQRRNICIIWIEEFQYHLSIVLITYMSMQLCALCSNKKEIRKQNNKTCKKYVL